MIDKQGIINLCCDGSKSYVAEVLGDSEITFLREGEDTGFCPSLYCYCLETALKKVIKFPYLPCFWGIFCCFSDFDFFHFYAFWVICPGLTSSWLLISFVIVLVTLEKFPSRLLECPFHIYITFLSFRQVLIWLLKCSSCRSLFLLPAMLFRIVYLLPSLLSYWPDLESISFCSFFMY